MNLHKHSARREGAFTLTDLLFVMLMLALLAIVVFPAFADVQTKGGRLQCANNLRQIGQDSMIYAGENNGWLPICTFGAANGEGAKTNFLGAPHYARFVFTDATPHSKITTNAPPLADGNGYQNLGYLYQAGLAGNGSIFYCPAATDPPGSEQYYEPLLTADSLGTVRSSYLYNPRVVNPNVYAPVRRYQKSSDLQPHKLFAMDYLNPQQQGGMVGIGINPVVIQHVRDRGWNVLFTDGSVQFSRLNNTLYGLILQNLSDGETAQSFTSYDKVFNELELDH